MTELKSWDEMIARRRKRAKIPDALVSIMANIVELYGIRAVSRELAFVKLRRFGLIEIAKRRIKATARCER